MISIIMWDTRGLDSGSFRSCRLYVGFQQVYDFL